MSFDVKLKDGTIRSYDTCYLEDYTNHQLNYNPDHSHTPCDHCECEKGDELGAICLECAIATAKHNGPGTGNFLIVTGMLTLVIGFGLPFIILGFILNKIEENRPLRQLEALWDKGTIERMPAPQVFIEGGRHPIDGQLPITGL
jgi:hypothetical protein